MTKKRSSNGFMYFADGRRSVYEAENKGVHLTGKELVERATRDWKMMNEEERQKWRNESRRRREEYERQVYQMESISIMKKSKTRPLSKLELSLQPKAFSYRLTELKRKSLRQSIYQKLIWREKENMTEMLAKKRFGLLTVRPYCMFESNNNEEKIICLPAEICTYVMSLSEGIVESKHILIRHDYPANHQFFQISRISENGFSELSQTSNHLNVHHAYLQIANEMKGCWANLILVPASQYQNLAASLAWIKQKRDISLKRDTVSIRTERLICMEDMIAVIARIFEMDVDDSSRWEQNISSNLRHACDLHTAAPNKCAVVVGKSACEHFLDILRNLANRSYRKHNEYIFGNGDAEKRCILNPNKCHNRINPFQVALYSEPNDDQTNNNNEPFSLIRLRTPDKMQYVMKWLNSLDLNTTPMLENENIGQAFTENFQTKFSNGPYDDFAMNAIKSVHCVINV